MIQEIVKAFFLIFVAEMGDKTQILAMAFATKYPIKKVLLGIFIGAFLNHGIAVALGATISDIFPLSTIQIVAGIAFIGFALWTLIGDDSEEGEGNTRFKIGPVLTVSLAFFIGELGDKTQLTAITLASEAEYPVMVLCGTVSGMIVTGGIGIWVGKKIGDKVPELVIKLLAAAVFMVFGILKLFNSVPIEYQTPFTISLFFVSLSVVLFFLIQHFLKRELENKESAFKRRAEALHEFYRKMDEALEDICLGEKHCKKCLGNRCVIGCTKSLSKLGLNNFSGNFYPVSSGKFITEGKDFDRKKLLKNLRMTADIIKFKDPKQKNKNLNTIRQNLEYALRGYYSEKIENWDAYEAFLEELEKKQRGQAKIVP